MAELAGHWAAETPMAETPWLNDAAQAAQKYQEAAAVAAEACAEDTAGQTCYICHGEGDEDEGLVRGCACRGATGYAHVSCLARLAEDAGNRELRGAGGPGFVRWHTCGLCEQRYHGLVACALGWACWKLYVSSPPDSGLDRRFGMGVLGSGLSEAKLYEDALSVKEADLSMRQRDGASERSILIAQGNLAYTCRKSGRHERALQIERDAHAGWLRLYGEEDEHTLIAAGNYATTLTYLQRFGEAKALLRRTIPVAQRVLGANHQLTHQMSAIYAEALYKDDVATLDDLREAVMTLEDAERIARRVLSGAHSVTTGIERRLRESRAALGARETAPPPPPPPPPPAPLYDEDELD
jgi:hypothetical protein